MINEILWQVVLFFAAIFVITLCILGIIVVVWLIINELKDFKKEVKK